jgi:hypothetical protein
MAQPDTIPGRSRQPGAYVPTFCTVPAKAGFREFNYSKNNLKSKINKK